MWLVPNIFYTKKTASFQENLYLRKNMENLRKQKRHLQQQVWPPKIAADWRNAECFRPMWVMKKNWFFRGFVGDYTVQLYRDYSEPSSRSLLKNQYFMESIQPGFFRGPRSIFGREVESIEARLRNVEAQKLQYQKLFEDFGMVS